MDSDIALALMEKARRVYESENTYLSFPVSPISFKAEELNFFEDSGDDETGKKALNSNAQFSRLVNLIPTGLIFPPDEERYLWDVYDDILNTSIVAFSDRTTEEEVEYRKVLDFLYDETVDGIRVASSVYSKYQEFYDASITLREEFNAEKIEAELSDSNELKQQWGKERLPEWRKRFDALDMEWRGNGSKDKIEQVKRREKSLAERSPISTWSEWSSMFDKDLDMDTDIQSLPFVRTRYLPFNATQDGSWTKFSMSKPVAKQLIMEAPEELRKKLEGQSIALDKLTTLTFEYSTAKIDRFWFTPQLFNSHFFKYSKLISEGTDSKDGRCPAYIAGVVFAKNIHIVQQKHHKKTNPTLMNAFPIFSFANPKKAKIFKATQMKIKSMKLMATPFTGATLKRSKNESIKSSAFRNKSIVSHMMTLAVPRTKKPLVKSAPKMTRLNVARMSPVITLFNQEKTSMKPTNKPNSSKPASPENDESIYILAFICKKVPKCPDPDLSLTWSFE
ncbi:MAG: hypothetical protein L3J51_12985 [Cocleimonas sp.]|nr:hypothetical protein [Cocleimonas sp.]